MSRGCWVCLIAGCWLLLGCSSGPGQAPARGEAYVGASTLRLRQELGPRAPEVALLKHGDRVEIIGRRRRFVKVRTAQGAEGWTDTQQLLSPTQMQELNRMSERAAGLPSQGAATVLGSLNVHTEPHRQAPGFYRIREGELVEVVDQRVVPRLPYQSASLGAEPPEPPRQPRRSKSDESLKLNPPRPPQPPDNWLERSGGAPQPQPEVPPAKPVPEDDWSLVRLPNGRAGWALTRMLRMNIPDEVAQYSEGHFITSYFALGQTLDGGQVKRHWLWTTISKGLQPYQFDSFRYFVWSTRNHRYETAYIERRFKGYFPVTVHPVEVTSGRRTRTMSGFSVIIEEADGARYRRTYLYDSYVVRLVSKTQLAEAAPAQSPISRP